ncbi:hypothetical protein LEP1GSC096_1813 [Leptospira interrogans serovar Hebdomadis str. R499]|nr:hypothetical protein LEP1GSC096_1813 [Leptospira interrogans serovar Hebdomadis str. R499]
MKLKRPKTTGEIQPHPLKVFYHHSYQTTLQRIQLAENWKLLNIERK